MLESEKDFEQYLSDLDFDDQPCPQHRDQLEQQLRQAFADKSSAAAGANLRPAIKPTRFLRLAAAAVLMIGLIGGLVWLTNQATQPAYAVADTIAAMRKVATLHVIGQFQQAGKIEWWMQIDLATSELEKLWVASLEPDNPIVKVSTPEMTFSYNRQTNVAVVGRPDQTLKQLTLRFDKFFEQVVTEALQNGSIEIKPQDKNFVLKIQTQSNQREYEFVVDRQTKLPIRMTCIKSPPQADGTQFPYPADTLKSLDQIYYNETPPDGLFQIPSGATIVEKEFFEVP